MGEIVSQLFVSLDGVHEAPERWHFPFYDERMAASVGAQINGADLMLLGRVTYEVLATSWPAGAAMSRSPTGSTRCRRSS
jgi:dihydrofolate reductase